jgi:hypothetical protein
MKRREFITLLTSGAAGLPTLRPMSLWPMALWPMTLRPMTAFGQAQGPPGQSPSPAARADNSIGQVASLTGSASVTRGNAARAALKTAHLIYQNDALQTDLNSSLGITFDDETTFNLSANTCVVIDTFVYQQGSSGNKALFNVTTGTAAFVASLVAKNGDMKIATPEATLGIRGTTGIVDVPAAGGGAAPTVKLYPDADGHVGQSSCSIARAVGLARSPKLRAHLHCGPGPAAGSLQWRIGSSAGGGTGSRRAAAPQRLAQYRPSNGHSAAAAARPDPPKPKQLAPGRRAKPASPARGGSSHSTAGKRCPPSRARSSGARTF